MAAQPRSQAGDRARPSTLKTSQMRPACDTMFSRTSWNSSFKRDTHKNNFMSVFIPRTEVALST